MRRIGIALAIALAPAVAWAHPADELPPGHWMELSLNVIEDVDPCPAEDCSWSAVEGVSGTIDDWCGGALASEYGMLGGLVVWGGGHNGYFGSEIYVFDIESQLWERVTEPYDDGSGSVAAACSDDGIYPDGSACPTHTYDRVDYHPGSNSFVILFASSDPVCGGCSDPNVHAFGFDDLTWSLRAAHPMPNPFTGASSAYDPTRDSYWLLPAYNGWFSQYEFGTDSWTTYQQYNLEIEAVSAIDPGRDLFVTVDGRGTHTVIVHDLGNPMAGGITVDVEGTSPVMEGGAGGFEWDPVSEQLVGWSGGAEVWILDAPDGDWASETWTWLQVDPAADNTVVPSGPNSNGTYSRWRHVPSLNVFVVVSGVSDPVYAYRLSDDPGTGPNDDSDSGGSESTGAPPSTTGGTTSSGSSTSNGSSSTTSSTSAAETSTATDDPGSNGSDGCGCTTSTPTPVWLVVLACCLARLGKSRGRARLGGHAEDDRRHRRAHAPALGASVSPAGRVPARARPERA